MPLKTQSGGGGDFTPAPEGTHFARCYRIIDLGTQHNDNYNKDQHKIRIYWELPGVMVETEDGERPAMVVKMYTLSHHENAGLRQDLESWYGKAFNDRDLDLAGGFDVSKVLGRPVLLSVVHVSKGDKTYANVKSLAPLMAGMEEQMPPAVNKPQMLILTPEEFDRAIYDACSSWEQETIQKSPEWQELVAGDAVPDDPEQPPMPGDSDIPF